PSEAGTGAISSPGRAGAAESEESRLVEPVAPSGAPSSGVPDVGVVFVVSVETTSVLVPDVVADCAKATCAFNTIRNGAATAAATWTLNQFLRIGIFPFIIDSPRSGARVHRRFVFARI